MRLSAVLVAVFTASATFGLSNSASGQTSYSESAEETLAAVTPAPSIELPDRPIPELTQNPPENRKAGKTSKGEALKIAEAPARGEGENDRKPPDRFTDTPSPVSPSELQLKPELASNPSPASSSQNALPEAQLGSPLPPERSAVTPAWIAAELGKPDESGAIAQNAQVTPRPAPTGPPTNTVPPLPPGRAPQPGPSPAPAGAAEPQVLVAEVTVTGATADLEREIYRVITTQPGRTTKRSQLQQDINAIFATGFFRNVRAVPEDTPLGVRVTFIVQANPVLRGVTITGQQVLPQSVIDESFRDQYGQILNLRRFEEGVKRINAWYQENGYVLGQITDAPQVGDDSTVTLVVAEGQIESVDVRFLNKEGESTDATGQPIGGNTRRFVVTREVELKPGDIFNRTKAERDLRRVFGLGIFEDVRLSFAPRTDPSQVVVVVDVIEKNTGSIAAGAGISSASGLFGSVSYQQQNLGGNK